LWSAPFGLKLLDYIIYKPNITAIDIGFGSGFPLIELAARLGNGSTVYGIDPWKKAVEKVKEKIDYYRIKNIKIIEGFAESIPLDNETVDLITGNNVINNVSDSESVIGECSRIIKKGGQFIQTMNLDKSMFEFYDQLKEVLNDLKMDKEIELMHKHISEKRPSLDKIITEIKGHGFVIKDLEHDQFNYKFTDGTAMLNHHQVRLGFMDSWISFLPADKTGEIFDRIENKLNEQSRHFGEIKLSIPYVMINAIKQ